MGALLTVGAVAAAELPAGTAAFIDRHCASCHDEVEKEAGLDLTAQRFQLDQPANFARWVQILDRVQAGEMPPKAKRRPEPAELGAFTTTLASVLASVDAARIAEEGRATRRRLNRHRTMVLYGSNLGNASTHTCLNLPTILAGGGFRHGQHLAFDATRNYPLPNLFVSMLQRMGLESDRFASSSGTMRGLEVA